MGVWILVASTAPSLEARGQIQVVAGSYGYNCRVRPGNVTAHLARSCNGRASCPYRVDHRVIGDPAFGCAKAYQAEWRCGGDPHIHRVSAPAEASGKTIPLSCGGGVGAAPRSGGAAIHVLSAIYGRSCGRPSNVTKHLTRSCNGRTSCAYRVDVAAIGDPAPGCQKDYVAQWRCGSEPTPRSASLGAEAHGQVITLGCSGGAAPAEAGHLPRLRAQIAGQLAQMQKLQTQLATMIRSIRQQPLGLSALALIAYQRRRQLEDRAAVLQRMIERLRQSQQALQGSPAPGVLNQHAQQMSQLGAQMSGMLAGLQQAARGASQIVPGLQQRTQEMSRAVQATSAMQRKLHEMTRKLIENLR